MTGNSTSAQLITIGVDIGSNIQLFFGEQPVYVYTSTAASRTVIAKIAVS